MIKAVIFDYEGVIKVAHPLSIDIGTVYNAIYKTPVEEAQKIKELTAPFFSLLQRGLINEEKFWGKTSEELKKPTPKNASKISRELYEKSFSFHSEMVDFVKRLKEKGLKTAVLSNVVEFQAEIIKKHNGYSGFDVVVLSYEEKLEKPEPDIYLLVIKRLGVKPEECIFIDDKEKNLTPAKNLGMKIVLAKNSNQTIKDVYSIIHSESEIT